MIHNEYVPHCAMSSHEELLESLERTLAEIEVLEAIYGCDEEAGTRFEVISPPSALEQARAMIFENNCDSQESVPDLEMEIVCQLDEDPLCGVTFILQCRVPAGYPAQEAAKVMSVSSVDPTILKNQSARESLTEELNQTAASLVGSEAVMELVEGLKESAPKHCSRDRPKEEQTKQTPASATTATCSTPKLFVISSHHLLDHAPDNFLAKGGKYKLKGVYRFGTPGLGLVVGYNDNTLLDVENFMAALEKKIPQKKFEIALTRDHHKKDGDAAIEGWEEATIDQLRELLTPEEFTSILNIQGGSSSASSNNNTNSKTKSQDGKHRKGGKKK